MQFSYTKRWKFESYNFIGKVKFKGVFCIENGLKVASVET